MDLKNLFKSVMMAACCLGVVSFASCSSDNDDDNGIRFSAYAVQVAPGATSKVLVGGGTQPYTAQSTDSLVAKVKIVKDTLFVTGVKEGKVSALVTDYSKMTGSVAIQVVTPLSFDKKAVNVEVGKEDVVTVGSGSAPYTAVVKDSGIVTATVKDAKITIKGVKSGTTTVQVVDKNKVYGEFSVTVK